MERQHFCCDNLSRNSVKGRRFQIAVNADRKIHATVGVEKLPTTVQVESQPAKNVQSKHGIEAAQSALL